MVASVPRFRLRFGARRLVAVAAGVALVLPAGVAAASPARTTPVAARPPSHRGVVPNPAITYYSLTKRIRSPYWITLGPDGNMWFTNPTGDTIGRITPKGVVTEFQLAKGTHPQTITAAADGNLWFLSLIHI